jgi:ABC-type branched-subunit amino acid transport system substrate-binding protein
VILGACSPKITRTVQPLPKPVTVTNPAKPVAPPVLVAPVVHTIALLLPFNLDKLDFSPSANSQNLNQAALAADYYQGFKFALDSLTAKGYNYKLQVFDSRGEASEGHSLAVNPKVRSSDLIVGPVFPELLKNFTATMGPYPKPIVSPLSPASPADYKDPNLITAIPPLAYHAVAAAKYITGRIKPTKVFLLKSGYSEENKYILPFTHAIDTLGKQSVTVVPVTVVHGNLDALIPQLSKSSENVFVVPATDEPFLIVTLNALNKLAQSYPITVFGHPNWAKAAFLQAELLQRLKTHITTSDRIDYKSPAIMAFIRNYKKVYHIEPTEYAIKGFDAGYYFGGLIGTSPNALKHLDQYNYTGLLNDFNFKKSEGNGWINTHVRMLQYQNFDLKPVQ